MCLPAAGRSAQRHQGRIEIKFYNLAGKIHGHLCRDDRMSRISDDEIAVLPVVGALAQIPAVNANREDGFLTPVTTREVNIFGVGDFARAPRLLVHPAIEVGKQLLDLFRAAVIHDEPKAVALITSPFLHAPGNVLAIGRIARSKVAAGAGGDFFGLCAGDWIARVVEEAEGEDVHVGRKRGVVDLLLLECNLFAVRGKIPAVWLAQRKRWNVVGIAWVEVAEGAVVSGSEKEVTAFVACKCVPVAIEQGGEDLRLHFRLFLGVVAFFVAGVLVRA